MLFKRYGLGAKEILKLELEEFIEQLNFTITEASEEKIFTRWVNGYQHMLFTEFKDSVTVTNAKYDERSVEEILKGLSSIF